MTEVEILTIRNDLTAIIIQVVSVSFAMISAYLAGLWLFLRRAPAWLRLIAFFTLSIGLAFMGVMTIGLNELMLGTERAWSKLGAPVTGISGFGNASPDMLMGFTMYEAAAALGALAFLGVYLALFYLTFFFRWPDDAVWAKA